VTHEEGENMTELHTVDAPLEAPATRTPTEDTSIRLFRARVSDEALADLRRRILATRWPDKETVAPVRVLSSESASIRTIAIAARVGDNTSPV
jgi:hypothetical protein